MRQILLVLLFLAVSVAPTLAEQRTLKWGFYACPTAEDVRRAMELAREAKDASNPNDDAVVASVAHLKKSHCETFSEGDAVVIEWDKTAPMGPIQAGVDRKGSSAVCVRKTRSPDCLYAWRANLDETARNKDAPTAVLTRAGWACPAGVDTQQVYRSMSDYDGKIPVLKVMAGDWYQYAGAHACEMFAKGDEVKVDWARTETGLQHYYDGESRADDVVCIRKADWDFCRFGWKRYVDGSIKDAEPPPAAQKATEAPEPKRRGRGKSGGRVEMSPE